MDHNASDVSSSASPNHILVFFFVTAILNVLVFVFIVSVFHIIISHFVIIFLNLAKNLSLPLRSALGGMFFGVTTCFNGELGLIVVESEGYGGVTIERIRAWQTIEPNELTLRRWPRPEREGRRLYQECCGESCRSSNPLQMSA